MLLASRLTAVLPPRSFSRLLLNTRRSGPLSSLSAIVEILIGQPLPHPDDVVIDYKTGDVRVQGPVLTEQREAQETALDNKSKFERDIEICITAMEANPDNLELRRTHDELTKIVDWLRRGAPFAR